MPPAFPPLWLNRQRGTRTLATLRDRRITTEQGELIPTRTWAAVADALFSRDLVLYVDRLSDPPLWDAIEDPDATITTRSDGSWVGIAVRRGRYVRHVYASLQAWSRRADASLLADIRAMSAAIHVRGNPTTASGAGVASMAAAWSGERVYGPGYACASTLRDNLVGGRVDTLQPGRLYPVLWELDINDAYAAAAAAPLPGGSATWWDGSVLEPGPEWGAVTGYYLCDIIIHEPLTLGPVVLKVGPGEPNLIPSRPGRYRGWLWAEEVAALRACRRGPVRQVTVLPRHGWYWRRWAQGARSTRAGIVPEASPLSSWARRMHRARRSLPKPAGQLVKLATVAGIGRWSADPSTYRIVRAREGPDDRRVTDPELGVLALWVHRDERESATALPHWGSYVQMSVRLALYRTAARYAADGTLVASNYDALYVTTRPTERLSKLAGGWKLERLQDAVIPAARHLRSRTKTTLPGIPYEQRT